MKSTTLLAILLSAAVTACATNTDVANSGNAGAKTAANDSVCISTEVTGSRLKSTRCMSKSDAEAQRLASKEATDKLQRDGQLAKGPAH